MAADRRGIILLNDPTRGIDVGTKQEIYQLLRDLADAGTAILFYSTDYDELIGCCDRVLILYDGAVVRELAGDAITEDEHRRQLAQPGAGARPPATMRDLKTPPGRRTSAAARGRPVPDLLAAYNACTRRASASTSGPERERGFVASMVAMAQTLPVLTGGLDLSVGAVMTLGNCVASSS